MASTDKDYASLRGMDFKKARDILTKDGFHEHEYGDKDDNNGYAVYRKGDKEVELTYEWVEGKRKGEAHAGKVTNVYVDDNINSSCGKKSVNASAVMGADDISGVKILVRSEAYVDITEDNYEHGASTSISNQWDFDVRGEYDSMQALIDDIHSVSYQVFSDNIDDYSFGDGALRTSAMVNAENDVPTDEEYEAFKRGEITLYIADMWLPLEVGSVHDMTDDEAESFGIKEIW